MEKKHWQKGRATKLALAQQLAQDPLLLAAINRSTRNKELKAVIQHIRKRIQERRIAEARARQRPLSRLRNTQRQAQLQRRKAA
jgi:hypothetical protein